MMQKTLPPSAAQSAREALFQRTGWIFVSAQTFRELWDVGVVQRFGSLTGDYVHEVRVRDGLGCSCPGWRKYAKCWHIRWVLAHNVAADWTIGTFVRCVPNAREAADLDASKSWREWFDKNIAVVEPKKAPPGPTLLSGPAIVERRHIPRDRAQGSRKEPSSRDVKWIRA